MSGRAGSARLYWPSRAFLWLASKIYLRFESHGWENVPATGGCIVACNHVSYLDPPILGAGIPHRVVRFMARDTLFKPGLANWLLSNVATVPISRDRGDVAALRKGIHLLKEGECLALFPEGTRSPDGELKEAKGGIGFLIAKSNVPVIPAYIDGSYRAWPRGAKFIKPVKVTIHYGKPITPAELESIPDTSDQYVQIGRLVMDRIRQIRDQIPHDRLT